MPRHRPGALLEVLGDRLGNESGPDGIHVPVAIAALLMGIEALRHDHVQVILRARHRDIEEPSLGDHSRAALAVVLLPRLRSVGLG